MAMATVRRRAVYALAVLALLCGCCSSVCGAATSNVKVDVLCPSNEKKVRLRVSGQGSSDWTECLQAVNYDGSHTAETASAGSSGGDPICLLADSWCLSFLEKNSPSPTEGQSSNDATFTMDCTTDGDSKSPEMSKGQPVTTTRTGVDLLGTSGRCMVLPPHQSVTGAMPGQHTPVAQPSPSPSQAAATPSSVETQQGVSSAGSSAGTGVSAPNDAGQSGSAGPTGSQGTLTSPTGAADSSKATGDGAAQAPSASAQPSGTSTPDTPAGSDGGSATTTTTSSSPSGGKHTKGNADGSGTLTVWVRGTLLLLLTAAVACAAGE
ncbi:mucin-like glycoprotein [Trypanosoma rangeli]|uniref:Mucin-like glycoprotein n=1 Tax=Trypanosoma rangeli TaxID=5698 RepID=A0A422MPY0_TRYRA|nr:mucin-like glycoprotein [Trypanosoma rangeli]RNE95260.1 mucin-like glycoprotein [Trypanosoma rangeli]|eukprot:RNE95260.1 mucin-like glycoprotein [Trypanosoma rangeli]